MLFEEEVNCCVENEFPISENNSLENHFQNKIPDKFRKKINFTENG